jgi:nucleotide-binding universal stress UspA family protein
MEPSGGADLSEILDSVRSEGKKVLEEAAAQAEKEGVHAETAQLESRGRPVSDVILSDVKRSKSDVIVMGTHGRRGLNRLLLGSDAERVLRDAAVPVLLTRQKATRPRSAGRKAKARRAG